MSVLGILVALVFLAIVAAVIIYMLTPERHATTVDLATAIIGALT